MTLTAAEIGYLQAQRLGRLATLQPDGSPQVRHVPGGGRDLRDHPEDRQAGDRPA
jgi:Pyridoxamine 5'-phosphate oxidase